MTKSMELKIEQLQEEVLALNAICAVLIAELSLFNPDPPGKLATITASLMGMSEAVAAASSEDPTTEITKTIERISSMAESVLVRKG